MLLRVSIASVGDSCGRYQPTLRDEARTSPHYWTFLDPATRKLGWLDSGESLAT